MEKLIVANWKMNPRISTQAVKLAMAEDFENAVIVPPFVFLDQIKKNLKRASLGAQDVFWINPPINQGAYTGEISPLMLKNAGANYVIIGHSERRQLLKENDKIINKKITAALKAGLKVILCVGEPLSIRKKGLIAVQNFIKNQLRKNLEGIKFKSLNSRLIIAYEPIWAIGAGTPAKPEDAVQIHKFIKKILNIKPHTLNPKIIYGGSVNSRNLKFFLKNSEIDGALVGGASLNPKEFKKIVKISLTC